jgi:hypothetical protein
MCFCKSVLWCCLHSTTLFWGMWRDGGEVKSSPLSDHGPALCHYYICDHGNRVRSLCWNMWVGNKMILYYMCSLFLFRLSSIYLNNQEYTMVHSFSYEAWPSLGYKTANRNSGVGTAEVFSCSLAAVWDIASWGVQCIAVVMFYHSDIASLAWTISLSCKVYLATLVSLAL